MSICFLFIVIKITKNKSECKELNNNIKKIKELYPNIPNVLYTNVKFNAEKFDNIIYDNDIVFKNEIILNACLNCPYETIYLINPLINIKNFNFKIEYNLNKKEDIAVIYFNFKLHKKIKINEKKSFKIIKKNKNLLNKLSEVVNFRNINIESFFYMKSIKNVYQLPFKTKLNIKNLEKLFLIY